MSLFTEFEIQGIETCSVLLPVQIRSWFEDEKPDNLVWGKVVQVYRKPQIRKTFINISLSHVYTTLNDLPTEYKQD